MTMQFPVPGPGLVTVAAAFAPAAPAPAPPGTVLPAPTLPAGFVTVGAPVPISIDPASPTWDSAPGQTPIYGQMNNVSCSRANMVKGADGLHVRLSSQTVGATATTLPQHDPANPRSWGGAATGFTMAGGVLELGIVWPVVNGKIGAWFAGWLDPVDNVWPGHDEDDFAEVSRWQGGSGVLTVNEHDSAGNPGWAIPNMPQGSGAMKMRHTIVRKPSALGALVSTFANGVPVQENFQSQDANTRHYLILSAGLGAGQPVPPLPCDMVVTDATYWPLG